AKKPVVAFIRGTGASGGYFLACAAERIVAQRSSIVGSIGVITIRPAITELLGKIGVTVNVEATGPLKGMGMPFRDESAAEKAKNKQLIDAFFEQFLDVVVEGRHVSRETARSWATGEVFWGRQALEKGLVDELGELEHAITVAAKLGDVPEKNVVSVRPHVSISQRLMHRVGSSASTAIRAEIDRWFTPRIELR
ncbi:MAG: S49 family peptidase, partial [Dehalococcoidia bacterium]